ncbi:MAG TPA: AAA family ATPase, partial [Bacteroidia bacterium]|nr:AAA family ATPase [Bacteroidia bacterium]
MYINKIIIKKFRHLENEELGPFNFNNKNSDLIVFAGPNGSGKSSVLELIGYGLSSSYSLSWQLTRTFTGFSF